MSPELGLCESVSHRTPVRLGLVVKLSKNGAGGPRRLKYFSISIIAALGAQSTKCLEPPRMKASYARSACGWAKTAPT